MSLLPQPTPHTALMIPTPSPTNIAILLITIIYQSSSSSLFPCILICLILNASANPPARLGALLSFLPSTLVSGVSLPLPPLLVPILTALSLGAGGGAGFLPAPGRFGGAGGVGFALLAAGRGTVPLIPFVAAAGGGGGLERVAGCGGAGGGRGFGASSTRYAEGVQPWEEPSSFLASHQPMSQVSTGHQTTKSIPLHTIAHFLEHFDRLIFAKGKLVLTLARKVIQRFVGVLFSGWWSGRWRGRRCSVD